MCAFGISFTGDFAGMLETPKGHAPSVVQLGSRFERVFSDLSIWSKEDYLAHWTAAAVRNSDYSVFCDSITRENASVWVGIFEDEMVRFFNRLVPARDLRIRGLEVSLNGLVTGSFAIEGLSFWDVPKSYIRCLADSVRT